MLRSPPTCAGLRHIPFSRRRLPPLHLLQSSLVHINTLLLQQVLAEPAWAKKLSDEDPHGLTALFWSNINPYGTFRLDMNKRLGPRHPLRIMITHQNE
ncbi:Tn3 family transposase [Streptomyces sp. NBC_00648]|uniref:Tn3 family transposase n=1 Tax=Streptomyces sp. NBC_00648 TaxID=2975797 RepID=UPI003250C1BC